MAVHKISPHLFLIDLDLQLPGYRQFISSWVFRGPEATLLVDPGPASTIPKLLQALRQIGVSQIDWILLTHIHIDHAGGAGLLSGSFPAARVHCHEKAVRHLTAPEKLQEGTRKVLGSVAEAYGPIVPVPAEALFSQQEIDTGEEPVRVIATPGHAAHHLCYQFGNIIFAGEVAGVKCGPEIEYLRPATPPLFKYDIYKNSLQKMAGVRAEYFCMGHYGFVTDGQRLCASALEQLHLWIEIVEANPGGEAGDLFRQILIKDPLMRHFDQLPDDVRQRERYFCCNSIKGMMEYVHADTAPAG